MPFAEDLAPFFAPSDFGSAALWNGAPVLGIFDRVYLEPIGNSVEGTSPVFQCPAASVVGVAQGDTLTIAGDAYTVRGVEPDGTGLVLLRLEAQ